MNDQYREISLVINNSRYQYSIPMLCPCCGVANNPTSTPVFFANGYAGVAHLCPVCNQYSITIHTSDQQNKILTTVVVYPSANDRIFNELIVTMSPEFVSLYNQSYNAEQLGFKDLSGIGYRSSLEILIKDFALAFELDSKENIAKLNLNRAIEKFFKHEAEFFTSADVVRKIGNNFTHWDKNDEYLDIIVLKEYLEIFIQAILVKLMIKHPPV